MLPVPARTEGQQRRYGHAAVARLNFIRHARELGFEPAAVRELLALSEQPDRPVLRWNGVAMSRTLTAALLSFVALRRELQTVLFDTRRARSVGAARVIEALVEQAAA